MAPCSVLGLLVLDKVAQRIFLTLSAQTEMEHAPTDSRQGEIVLLQDDDLPRTSGRSHM